MLEDTVALLQYRRVALVTDLQPKELRSIFCLLHEVDETTTLFLDVPEEMVDPPDNGIMIPDSEAIAGLLEQMETWTETLVWPPEP